MPETNKKLEIKVRTCKHLNLNVLRDPGHVDINLGEAKERKIDVKAILDIDAEEIMCKVTKKPCVLYKREMGINPLSPYIEFRHLERCPSGVEVTRKYAIEGKQEEHMFYASKVEAKK